MCATGAIACDKSKMTPKYCAQQCMLWQPDFVYSGVAFKTECWCGSSLQGTGVNTKVSDAECSMACAGDASAICGGQWFANLSRCGGDGSWGVPLLSVLLPAFAAYVAGGALYGRRRNSTASGHGASFALASHPHWAVWHEVASLCTDGLHYSRGGRAGRVPPRDLRESLEGQKSKHKSKSKPKKGKAHQSGAAQAQQPPDPPAAPPPTLEREWKPAPRASHLSSGARETGVKIQL